MFNFGKNKESQAKKALNEFVKTLDEKQIKYVLHNEQPAIFITYSGENFNQLTFTFIFDDTGKSVSLKVYSIAKFREDQLADAYSFCNEMNCKYRWISFYVDQDNEFTASMDAVINAGSIGDECCELLYRAVSIVDDVYKELMS